MKQINIVHLYPYEMNIYGDTGNVMVLDWRLTNRGFKTKIYKIGIGDKFPTDTDIIVAGGGQDSGQAQIQADLKKRTKELRAFIDDGVVALTVCGMYQLFGHYFKPEQGQKINGVGIFDAVTEAGDTRMIGNIVISSPWGKLVGFENHSGLTTLGDGQLPLGKVIKGKGNNSTDNKEGAVSQNAFGTYLHGPILPKNPKFADELLRRALDRKYGLTELEPLDDSLAAKAAEVAFRRP